VSESSLATPVTIIVPAYNEAPVIVASVRSLLASRFAELEVLVVNDGSTDDTLARLSEAFDLVPVERVPRSNLPSAAVRGIYASPHEGRLTVVDKENAGKADALNCGIAFAAYPLFCSIDSDTMLDPGALARLVWTFQAEPETVATGGIVRIVNGSTVSEQRVERVHTPRHILVNVQIMEYLRAFFGGRAGWSRAGMVVIISGAFGLFRRDVVVDAGGYDADTVGEDAELVVRLHRHCRERGMKSGSRSWPTRSAGPRRPATSSPCAASATAGSAGSSRCSGSTAACSAAGATGASGWSRCPTTCSSRPSAR
jgi:cellulose synthase/poly-beta-1,6-N-acetylglucosamine synthase-like glycosyltransferase